MPSYIQGTGSNQQELYPDGTEMPFVIENATEKESSSGNEMIELGVRLLNGSEKGPLIIDYLPFTEKAYGNIDSFRVCTGDKLTPGQEMVFTAEDCLNRRGRAVLKIDNYGGRERNKIDYYITDRTTKTATRPGGAVVARNELNEPSDVPF